MCWARFGVLCCVGVLAACSEQPPKLSKEEIELLDAVTFALTGIENNTKESYGLTPWIRQVAGRTVEFGLIGKNGIGTSDDETNKVIMNSSYVRYVQRVSSPEHCVFRREHLTEFSKGNSREDFTAYSMHDDLEPFTFNLANAYRFELEWFYGQATISMQGPGVVCWRWGSCENSWDQTLDVAIDRDRPDYKPLVVLRRERAIGLIKKTCPGKPY
jgi:hypothetical protein